VALIGAGEFFGEIGFFDKIGRVRDIRATEASTIRLFDDGSLERMKRAAPVQYGAFLDVILRNVCSRFRRILSDREPLTAYAASLSPRRNSFDKPSAVSERFLGTPEWHFVHKVVEEFKAGFFDLSMQLQTDARQDTPLALQHRCSQLLSELNDRLQGALNRLNAPEIADPFWGFLFKEIFPYFMRSHFAERAYFKPKGYAGDFVMMEMIYRNQPHGDGKLGVLVDGWCLNTKAAKAVRGRRRLLSQKLRSQCDRRFGRQRVIRIMNLAGGTNRELFDFLAHCGFTDRIEATCVDADPDALAFTSRRVDVFPHRAAVRLMNENVVKWALGRAQHDYGLQDIIYTAGLTDYLDDGLFLKLLARCYGQLRPGGVLIISNFSPDNPNRAFMDHVLQWKLIHRDRKALHALFGDSPFGGDIQIVAEPEGINLFAVAEKKQGPGVPE
jgi:SAM-dependent methyltransferase/CRP-like cAMP-binding protein